jgi:acyl carrier protein
VTMSTSSVEAVITEIASKILRKDVDLTTVNNFKELGADSLDIIQIIVKVEDRFDIELLEEDLQNIKGIKDFVAYVERRIAEKNSQ